MLSITGFGFLGFFLSVERASASVLDGQHMYTVCAISLPPFISLISLPVMLTYAASDCVKSSRTDGVQQITIATAGSARHANMYDV